MEGTLRYPVTESDVWRLFRKAWPYHCERQEPGSGFDVGRPDVIVLDRIGQIGMMELKAPSRVYLRPSQWAWHERWIRCKGKSCIVTCQSMALWRVYRIDPDARTLNILNEAKGEAGWTNPKGMIAHVASLLHLRI